MDAVIGGGDVRGDRCRLCRLIITSQCTLENVVEGLER